MTVSARRIREVPSPNFGERKADTRVEILLLHYTGMKDALTACRWMCDERSEVSSHYLVDEHGVVTRLVPEEKRAWHAGVSYWAGASDINSRSIGIEIHNPGHERGYPDFPDIQMRAVIDLCSAIVARHPIPPEGVLAHSDVAPERKIDPGEKFPWERLHRAGIGHWVPPAPITEGAILQADDAGEEVADLQQALSEYGYGIEVTGQYDLRTTLIVTAFQRHFRPERVDGLADASTIDTVHRLLAARRTHGP